ncbi:MAG TPA: alkaline phosphatase family protein [Streptosporangiaceae bacterium]|nr:alkaline phosphatase family protein [Streptosporangiaceae bacterium]
MAQQSANIYITNNTDGTAYIKLYHSNDYTGIQNGSWTVLPGATAGPMTVLFEEGWTSFDWWSVNIAVEGGSAPGIYQNPGTSLYPEWKECQLQGADAGQNLTFAVTTTSFDINLTSGGTTDSMGRLADFSKITNVFVLMLENHSFDNMFGQSGISGITHASTTDGNEYKGVNYQVGKDPAPKAMPTDPGHEFQDVVEQLAGEKKTYPYGGPYPPIHMSGFAANYATSSTEGPVPPAADIGKIMQGFATSTQLPVIYTLATVFALCDHWFSSMPGPTWPNRFFVHGASSAGLDHSPTQEEMATWIIPGLGLNYPNGSFYARLSAAGLAWRIYNDDTNAYSDDPDNGSPLGAVPQVLAVNGVTWNDVYSLTQFAADLQSPYTNQYTFIEPNYGDITSTYEGGSSQHPMDDVYGGEGLIKAVYEAIRNSPVWDTSLLIITYDEHGGFYDSVAPGQVTPPDDGSPDTYNEFGFPFNQLGVRVPAVVVSPWIPAQVSTTTYDHSSALATVERLFGLDALTKRDENAADLRTLLSEAQPRTDTPTVLPDPASPRPRTAVEPETLRARLNEPVPESGNLAGFLVNTLKMDLELSATPQEREAARTKHAAVTTRGDARSYVQDVMARVKAAQAARARRTPGRPPDGGGTPAEPVA